MNDRKRRLSALLPALLLLFCAGCASSGADSDFDEDGWRWRFEVDPSDWSATGRNDWFVLEPGWRLELENERKTEHVVIMVLAETQMVDNVETRVVEERETKFGELEEVSRNYFAISKRTRDVYCFGEDVDVYAKGVIASHEGTWRAGVDLALFGLMLPANPAAGAKWYIEQAEGVALDRAEVIELGKSVETPAGKFEKCLEIEETTPLDSTERSRKVYARGIGLVKDGSLKLVSYGKAAGKP